MGLDMYLNRKIYIGANYKHRNITGTIDLYEEGKPIPIRLNQVSEITLQVGYWRKANAIHKWFVNNVQNGVDKGQESFVTKKQLIKLRDLCQQVLAASQVGEGIVVNGYSASNGGPFLPNLEQGQVILNREVADKLLPTSGGFFFGSTDYDQWYLENLKETVRIIDAALQQAEEDDYGYPHFTYQASW